MVVSEKLFLCLKEKWIQYKEIVASLTNSVNDMFLILQLESHKFITNSD